MMKDKLLSMQAQEEAYWRQKSHVKWLTEGDKNTSFFHSIVLQKRAATTIRELQDDQGTTVCDPSLISHTIVDYYQNLFTSQVTS